MAMNVKMEPGKQLGELQNFTNGMNLSELMYKYTSTEMLRNVGFCMHSDWVIGYFLNYHDMSGRVAGPY